MSQASFVKKHESVWREFENLLDELEEEHPAVPADHFPQLYRTLCQHLSIARHRGYSAAIIERLNPLVERGHALLYGSRVGRWESIIEYLMGGFARDVRKDWPLLAVATLLFAGPYLGMIWWLSEQPEWAYHVLGPALTTKMEAMYESSQAMQAERAADTDIAMFGFYIYNNVGIALRTFAAGLFAGVGVLVALFYNGTVLGAVSGHLTNVGLGEHFWPFVIGHGSFELTAIVLAGQAGLKLGFAPVWPGRRSRMRALREEARDSLGLVAGFFTMLVIAAFIEAFWSSAQLDAATKYTVGGMLWVVVLGYLGLAGRGDGSR